MDRLSFTVEAMIRGYHVYRDVCSSVLDEELLCQRETGNISNPFAVSVLKDGVIVAVSTEKWIDYLPCFWSQKILRRFTLKSHVL